MSRTSVIGLSKIQKAIIVLAPMVLGGIIGWFVPTVAKWILKLPIIPLEKLFVLITSLNSLWVSIVFAVIGVILDYYFEEKKKDDAKYLREDLAKLGAVIRDERNGQYVRLAKRC